MRPLRDFTNARVDLGRTGDSIPTRAMLDFRLAHARARDAVHLSLDMRSLVREFSELNLESVLLTSQAADRYHYLLRPDLGRKLSRASEDTLANVSFSGRVLFCVADGLSAAAVHRHAGPLLKQLQPDSPVMVIEQGRVAIGDQIGELVNAELCVMLIGERPGLSSPDSLGVYLTYRPRVGCTDAKRNCVSNIHDLGLSYEMAAHKILFLVHQAQTRRLTGVQLKERAGLLSGAS